jgi:hypothetical protein
MNSYQPRYSLTRRLLDEANTRVRRVSWLLWPRALPFSRGALRFDQPIVELCEATNERIRSRSRRSLKAPFAKGKARGDVGALRQLAMVSNPTGIVRNVSVEHP